MHCVNESTQKNTFDYESENGQFSLSSCPPIL
jgi:hypothetical protein